MCKILPVKHVAEFFGPDRKTVRRIDKAYLQETIGPPDLSGVEVVVMDEFAIQKGHRYATVIVEPTRKEVLWVGRGRGREDVRPFFELLGEEGRKRLRAVAMDMNGAYEEEVRSLKEYLPGILAHCRWRLHTSLLEGINNKIKVLKRMAYGYRDDEYFFLKIRQAFPGVGS